MALEQVTELLSLAITNSFLTLLQPDCSFQSQKGVLETPLICRDEKMETQSDVSQKGFSWSGK